MRSQRPGQVLVLLALAVAVLFGMLALVVDLGLGMVQLRGLQNAADAGSMNGARSMASSVATDASNNVIYVSLTNQSVHDRVLAFVTPNRPATLSSFTYVMAVQFLDCSNSSLGFTAASDAGFVAALGGTLLASSTTVVPNNTCSLRVHTQVSYPSLFARVIGQPTQTVTARATARIAPTNPPTTFSGVWPISHWTYNDSGCTYSVGTLCTFWDSNSPPGGNFKEAIDMSRYSTLMPGRNQHWVDYDHSWAGNNGKTVDLPRWLRYGWRGTVFVDEFDTRCQEGTASLACPNSKLEIYGGDTGNNMADMMRAYINDPANLQGTETGRGNFATIGVFFWRFGEQGINLATDSGGSLWGNSANPLTENPNSIQRIILQKVRGFKFYTSTVSSSNVQGYYVSLFVANGTPRNGPPSAVANTVILSD